MKSKIQNQNPKKSVMDVWAIERRNNNAISAPLADQYSFEVTNRKHFQFPPQLLPSQPTAENFVQVWQTLWSVLVQQYPCCGFSRLNLLFWL